MNIFDTIPIAIRALAANKMRSMLTMLGIVIGVGAVIALMAAGQGAQKGITDRIRGLGSNLLFIRPGQPEDNASNDPTGGQVFTLVSTDGDAINDPERFPYVDSVTSQVFFEAPVTASGQSLRVNITGVTPDYQYTRNHYVETGRFINDDDVTRKGLVAVLGPNVAEQLFGDVDPIGRPVRLTVGAFRIYFSFSFLVVGVMESKGATATGNEDDLMLIPLPTMQARIPFIRHPKGLSNVHQLTVKVTDPGKFAQAKEEISALLRERHGVTKNDFTIDSQEDLVSTVSAVSQTLTVLLGSIAGISLVVGGIGIMNIMLVSVTERTREIGIRKALGARRVDILWQFIVEALTVTMLGGMIGVGSGVLLAQLANGRHLFGRDLYTAVTPFSIIVAFSVSAAIGLFFGIYPAYRASRLNPIEALRHE
ncbi:MAG TPA: ABC transporter permease [Dehalococcoidia bacterium]|nr:ABC transporter permease [Dehalococcoidia bacterium]